MPGSIWQIQTEPDGGLDYIRQYPTGQQWDPNRPGFFGQSGLSIFTSNQGPIIPVDRLVAHVTTRRAGTGSAGRGSGRSTRSGCSRTV
jgi:hypothetical protein